MAENLMGIVAEGGAPTQEYVEHTAIYCEAYKDLEDTTFEDVQKFYEVKEEVAL